MFSRSPQPSRWRSICRGDVAIALILLGAAIAFGIGMSLIAGA